MISGLIYLKDDREPSKIPNSGRLPDGMRFSDRYGGKTYAKLDDVGYPGRGREGVKVN